MFWNNGLCEGKKIQKSKDRGEKCPWSGAIRFQNIQLAPLTFFCPHSSAPFILLTIEFQNNGIQYGLLDRGPILLVPTSDCGDIISFSGGIPGFLERFYLFCNFQSLMWQIYEHRKTQMLEILSATSIRNAESTRVQKCACISIF